MTQRVELEKHSPTDYTVYIKDRNCGGISRDEDMAMMWTVTWGSVAVPLADMKSFERKFSHLTDAVEFIEKHWADFWNDRHISGQKAPVIIVARPA